MASGVTVYCDGTLIGDQPCKGQHVTRLGRVEYARDTARTYGWTRRRGVDLCPDCSVREYGPRLKGHAS